MSEAEMWMENLEEWILDQNQVISAKHLSRSLQMNITVATKRLSQFLKTHGDTKNLEAIYFVAGYDPKSKKKKKILVRESDINDNNLVEVTSKHLYAIGKKTSLGKNEQDLFNSLMATVNEFPHVNKYSAIVNEMAKPKEKIRVAPITKPVVQSTMPAKKATNSEKIADQGKDKNQAKPAVCQNKKKPGGQIAGMFAKAAAKKKDQNMKRKEPEKSGDDNETSPGKENRENEEREAKEAKVNKKVDKKKCKSNQQPKRKRIQIMSDSESSDEDTDRQVEEEDALKTELPPEKPVLSDSEGDDDLIPPTPESKPTTTELQSKTRRRKRKLVEKTFTDDQGFMVTKKEYESCSDSEKDDEADDEKKSLETKAKSPLKEKKESTDVEKKKKSRKTVAESKKQPSIMTFFKKK